MCEYDANNRGSFIASLCCSDAADLIVRCGDKDSQQVEDPPHQDIQVDNVQVEKLSHGRSFCHIILRFTPALTVPISTMMLLCFS